MLFGCHCEESKLAGGFKHAGALTTGRIHGGGSDGSVPLGGGHRRPRWKPVRRRDVPTRRPRPPRLPLPAPEAYLQNEGVPSEHRLGEGDDPGHLPGQLEPDLQNTRPPPSHSLRPQRPLARLPDQRRHCRSVRGPDRAVREERRPGFGRGSTPRRQLFLIIQ